jgi:hypothetical protein
MRSKVEAASRRFFYAHAAGSRIYFLHLPRDIGIDSKSVSNQVFDVQPPTLNVQLSPWNKIWPGYIGSAMRRSAATVVLILSLGVFLCPAVGKPSITISPKRHACCAKMSERSIECGGCAKEQSQPVESCPVPCSALILHFAPAESLSVPTATAHLVSVSNERTTIRSDRPPVPPPRS